jgi:hypothetical protein
MISAEEAQDDEQRSAAFQRLEIPASHADRDLRYWVCAVPQPSTDEEQDDHREFFPRWQRKTPSNSPLDGSADFNSPWSALRSAWPAWVRMIFCASQLEQQAQGIPSDDPRRGATDSSFMAIGAETWEDALRSLAGRLTQSGYTMARAYLDDMIRNELGAASAKKATEQLAEVDMLTEIELAAQKLKGSHQGVSASDLSGDPTAYDRNDVRIAKALQQKDLQGLPPTSPERSSASTDVGRAHGSPATPENVRDNATVEIAAFVRARVPVPTGRNPGVVSAVVARDVVGQPQVLFVRPAIDAPFPDDLANAYNRYIQQAGFVDAADLRLEDPTDPYETF